MFAIRRLTGLGTGLAVASYQSLRDGAAAHQHATELVNSGVSIEAVRRRLGHASAETTQLYALLDDKVAELADQRPPRCERGPD